MMQVGFILCVMGFDNIIRIYFVVGEFYGGECFMKFFRFFFFWFENYNIVDISGQLVKNIRGLVGSVVDYMVCLFVDIFMFIYDGLSNFVNNLLGYCFYYGF